MEHSPKKLEKEEKKVMAGSKEFFPESIEDFEIEARKCLDKSQAEYIFLGAETQSSLNRNISAFSRYLLQRRVLTPFRDNIDLAVSYFGGRIRSELPFFPAPVNCTPLYSTAIIDLIQVANDFSIPVFVSQLAVPPSLEPSRLPSFVKRAGSSLVWQIYMQKDNVELCYKQAKLAESWGYTGLVITVDAELNIKAGNTVAPQTAAHGFVRVTTNEIRKFRKLSCLPLIVKGVMTPEDSELAIESGADGIVVSNHGGRVLDRTPSTLEVLPTIAKRLKSKKRTRRAEIFVDGGIRHGTDVLIALASGARGCLLGRPVLWALACDHESGVARMIQIVKDELGRAAALCGVARISKIPPSAVRKADW